MKKQMTLSTDRKSAYEGEYIEIKWTCDACPVSQFLSRTSRRSPRMQYFFWAMYPFFKLVGMWNRMSEVAEAIIAVTKSGYHKPAIECRDISKLSKQ